MPRLLELMVNIEGYPKSCSCDSFKVMSDSRLSYCNTYTVSSISDPVIQEHKRQESNKLDSTVWDGLKS